MNRAAFFQNIRPMFGGRLKRGQVAGIDAVLDAWDASGMNNSRWLAYMLATDKHETAATMQPIREYGRGKGKKYGLKDRKTGHTYFGRGLVQLTWKANYLRAGKLLGLDLMNDPDLALRPDVAAKIMFLGMTEGWFRSDKKGRHTLERYFPEGGPADWFNAREIINGDKNLSPKWDPRPMGEIIADYAVGFHTAIQAARQPDDPGVDPARPQQPTSVWRVLPWVLAGAFVFAAYFFFTR